MNQKDNNKISLFGEFKDKSLENEYLADNMSTSIKATRYLALFYGFILMVFLAADYFAAEEIPLFGNLARLRILFALISMIVFFYANNITDHMNLIYLNTSYQGIIAATYLLSLEQFESLNFFSVLALMVITLAIYLLPNKIMFTQLISAVFSIIFFLYPIKRVTGLGEANIYRIIGYQLIFLAYCNIQYSLTETYKRKKYLANKQAMLLSVMDPLTGIYNRGKFDEEMNKWINMANRYKVTFSIILMDIDDFKKINDKYGHLLGDKVLINVVSQIRKSIRSLDVFARWGGDEFVILLPNTDINQAGVMAERIKGEIFKGLKDMDLHISCSFGVASYRLGDSGHTLLSRADNCLMEAKARGKDRVKV